MIKELLLLITTGAGVALYLYSWYAGITYPAWVPLVWCLSCFANNLYDYLESKHEHR